MRPIPHTRTPLPCAHACGILPGCAAVGDPSRGTHDSRLASAPLLRLLAEVPLDRRVEPQLQQIAIVPLMELATVMVMAVQEPLVCV